jgi:hypothetical protein
MLSQPKHYRCQGHQRQVVVRPFLVARSDPTKLFETQNAAVNSRRTALSPVRRNTAPVWKSSSTSVSKTCSVRINRPLRSCPDQPLACSRWGRRTRKLKQNQPFGGILSVESRVVLVRSSVSACRYCAFTGRETPYRARRLLVSTHATPCCVLGNPSSSPGTPLGC